MTLKIPGLLVEQNEKWQDVRSRVQQDLMRPQSAMFYIEKIQEVSKEFVEKIRRERNPRTLVIEQDLLEILHFFTFEAITLVATDNRMGIMRENPDPQMIKVRK